MAKVDPKAARTITWIAAIVAVVVAVVLPLGYFVLSYQNQAAALDAEAEINSRIAAEVINANPEMWRFQQAKLDEFLSRRPRHGYAEIRRILDIKNSLVAESVDPLPPPLLTRSMELRDSGVVVGRIEISRSLQPLLLRAALVGLLGLLLGAAVFATLRFLPLRALDRALEDNMRLLEESGRRYQEMEVLRENSQAILVSPDLKTTLEKILENTLKVASLDLGNIRLLDSSREVFKPVVSRGYLDQNNVERHSKHVKDRSTGTSFRKVLSHEVPVVEEDVQQRRGLRTFKREGVCTSVMVPVRTEQELLGALQVGCRHPRKFLPEEIHLLEAIGQQIGVAVQKERLNENIQSNLKRLRALYEIGLAIGSTLDLRAVLDLLMGKINLFLPYTALLVWLRNPDSGILERAACWNLDEADWKMRPLKGTPHLVKQAVETKAPVVVRDIQADDRTADQEFYRRHGLKSYLGVPLIAKGEVLGVLVFLTREEHEFGPEEIDFLSTLGGQAAIAIHNSRLHEHSVKQSAELAKASKVKDEFLGFVSHELRAPLNAVIAYAMMMQDKLLGAINVEQEKAVEKMLRYSKDLLAMINSLLEVTRIEAGKVEVHSHKVDLARFLEEFKSAYDAPLGKPIALNWDFPADLPGIRTDDEKLRHILQNLVNNAIKYTDRGSVTVSAKVGQQATGNGQEKQESVGSHASRLAPMWVEFRVADTGVGIPPESLPVIFDMFRQVSRPDGRSSAGVGLGLHIVKKFTELLEGKIEVESEVGKGSTFTVAIPLAPHQQAGKEEAKRLILSA